MVKTRTGGTTQPQSTPQLCSAAHNAGQPEESLYVTTTPMQRTTCERARHPSTLNVAEALTRIPKQPNSSCQCEAAYEWQTLVAYAEYRQALENGDDTTEQWAWLEYCISVFLFHYSRRFSAARIALPYFVAMGATTRADARYDLGLRRHCDIVAMQQEAGFSFHAVEYANDRGIGRRDAEVLLYSPGAQQFCKFLMLWYDIHNGGGGGVRAGPRAGRLMRAIIGAAAQQAPNQRHAPVVRHLVDQYRYVLFLRGGACQEMCPTVASRSPNAIDAPRVLLRCMSDATAAVVAAKDAIDAPLTIEPPTDAQHVIADGCAMELEDPKKLVAPTEPVNVAPMELDGGCTSLVELAGAKAVWGAPAARLSGVESVSSRHHSNGTMKITVATRSGGSITFDVAAPGDDVVRGDRVVVADPSVTGVATTASRAALVLDTPAHAFAGPYASSAELRVLPTPQLDDRVVRFFGSDEPVGDTLSGLGRAAGASLSAVSRDRGALLGRLMALLEGGSCDRGALCFEACSPIAAVLAPSMPTVSDDFRAVARAWQDLRTRTHKKAIREAFQLAPLDDDEEEAPDFVGRVLGTLERSKKNSFYKTLANAFGKADLGTVDREAAVLEALGGVSATDLLRIGSLPESSDASGGGGALVGVLPVQSHAAGAPPEVGFTEQDRLDLQKMDKNGGLSKPRLEAAFRRHGLPPWTRFRPANAAKTLRAHLEKLLEDADSDSEDDYLEDEADTTSGSGADASLEEFGRVLGKYLKFKGAANIVIGEDFLSRKLLSYVPTEDQDLDEDVAGTSTQRYKASDFTSASDVLAERFDEVVALLDVASLGALALVSHAGAAVVPIREAASVWIRRASTTDDEATPATFQSFLLDQFLPFGAADAPREERVEKAHELVVKMLLRAGEITVKEDYGVGSTPWQILRAAGNHSRFSFVEFSQLPLSAEKRNEWFQDYKASDVGCTVNTNIDRALTKKLLDQYLRRLLRDEARKQELETVVSRPSATGARAGVTLKTSLSTFLDLSEKRRPAFMDSEVKLKSYGNARTHSSPEAIKIIREATEKIEATLEELSKDFPARRDAAVEYLLSLPDFQPKTASECEQIAAVRSWLNDPCHVREVERAATGEKKKKKRKKRAEQGRAPRPR